MTTATRPPRWPRTAVTVPHVRIVREGGDLPNLGRVREPANAVAFLRPILDPEEVELFVVLHLNSQSNIIGYTIVSRGLLNASLVHPREVFRAAIAYGAAGVIVAHNHPSGDPTPSPEDRAVTRQLVEAGKLLDIPVYDHLILAGTRHLSFTESGLI